MLMWANKRLNEPKLFTRDVDFMVSEDFLIIFYESMVGQSPTGVAVTNLNPWVIDCKRLAGFM